MTTTNKKNQLSSKLSPNDTEQGNQIARYSGLAFELLGIILAGVGLGYGLDTFLENSIPYLTIVFSILSLIGMIFYLLRRLPKD